MTHDPGDEPVPDPDADRAAAVPEGETPWADEPSDVTAPDAGRPEAATSDRARGEVAASGMDHPDATASEVDRRGAAASDGGRPDAAASGTGHPDATASEVGRREVAASEGGRADAAASDVGWPEAATHEGGRSEVTGSDGDRPETATSDMARHELAAPDVGRREVTASGADRPDAATSDWTATDGTASAAAQGGAPTTEATDEYGPGSAAPSPRPHPAPPAWRSGGDPYETTRLPVTPTPDPRLAGDPSTAPPDRPGGTRVGAALFFDDRLADGQGPTYPGDAEDAPGRTLVDDAPTEAMAVVDAGGRHRAELGGDADADPGEWRPPRQTSRLTTVLVIALLVAIGFLAGVFVGRAAAPAPSSEQPRPAATSPARPGALR